MSAAAASAVQAFFLDKPQGGQRFCLLHSPPAQVAPIGVVIHAHALAEEMNKARHMVARQARALAVEGYAVMLVDLSGCGDSSGDFGEATWDAWVDDLAMAADWLSQRFDAPLTWWGLRAGCLLSVQAAQRWAHPCNFLFWQPSPSGATLLQQFLRLRAAASLGLADQPTDSRQLLPTLRAQLQDGKQIDVAGYRLSPGLARGLEQARLDPPASSANGAGDGSLIWLEVAGPGQDRLLPASQPVVRRWQDAGFATHTLVASGSPFWSAVEPAEVPALIDATGRALSSLRSKRLA